MPGHDAHVQRAEARLRFGQGALELETGLVELAADVDMGSVCADEPGGDGHALDEAMGSAQHDLAVLEGPRLALVRVDDDVLRRRALPQDGVPLDRGGEAGAAAALKPRDLQLGEEGVPPHRPGRR